MAPFDSVILLSFGGPEGPDDVLPFMENVTRGRGIPRERLVEVSRHYDLFGGVSPINGLNRALLAQLGAEFAARGIELPVYWGNRNWHPLLADTVAQMRDDGRTHALALVTSAYSSYSGCRQYLDDIAFARAAVGEGAPVIEKVRAFFDHPGFVEPMADAAIAAIGTIESAGGTISHLAFCAHSVPTVMADTSDYVAQLRETSQLVASRIAAELGHRPWDLVFQSRSGAPGQPWLEPDINDHLRAVHRDGGTGVAMIPVGFVSDHMEVVYDLDTQASATAAEIGLAVVRSATPGADPRFVSMLADLVTERLVASAGGTPTRTCLGGLGPRPDVCAPGCCPAPVRPAPASTAPPVRPAAANPGAGSGTRPTP